MSFQESVGDAIKGAVCTNLRLSDLANEFFNELSPVDLPNFSRYWIPRLCDGDPDAVPPLPVPFEGGQCVGVFYDVRLPVTDVSTGQPGVLSYGFNALGPITSAQLPNPPVGQTGRFAAALTGQNGSFTSEVGSAAFAAAGPAFLIRQDGQPDNCGDPPADIPPYQPRTYNINPTYVTNEGDEVTLEGDFTLYAPVFVAGNVIAPVSVNLGDINFNGTLELSPNFEFHFGTPPTVDGPGDGEDVPPNDDPLNNPETPEDETTRPIIGVIITSAPTGNTRTTEFPQGDAPTLYLPRIGSCYFRVRTANGLAWFGPVDIKQRRQFLPAPPEVVTLTARTFLEIGWIASTTLVYRDSQPSA